MFASVVCSSLSDPWSVLITFPPVSSDETHEHDAGVHVQVEGRGTEVAVDLADDLRLNVGVLHNSQREAEADEEVGRCQVLQEEGDAGHVPLTPEEVNVQGETVEEQTDLQTREGQEGGLHHLVKV